MISLKMFTRAFVVDGSDIRTGRARAGLGYFDCACPRGHPDQVYFVFGWIMFLACSRRLLA